MSFLYLEFETYPLTVSTSFCISSDILSQSTSKPSMIILQRNLLYVNETDEFEKLLTTAYSRFCKEQYDVKIRSQNASTASLSIHLSASVAICYSVLTHSFDRQNVWKGIFIMGIRNLIVGVEAFLFTKYSRIWFGVVQFWTFKR